MPNQRGIIPIQLLIYVGVFLAVAAVIAGGVKFLKDAGRDEVRAELVPKLEACGAEVEKHNQAAKALAAESARKAQEASRALRKASEKARVWEDNAIRLQKALTSRKADGPTDCRAAWQEIRKP